jgi:hypothetical protein
MGKLDDVLAADGAFMVDTDGFGETVTYTARGKAPKTLEAVVFRNPPAPVNGSLTATAPLMTVWVRNHATYGVTSVDTGGDTITVAERVGDTPKAHPVDSVLKQEGGMWQLRLR